MSDLFGNHIVGFPTRRLILLKISDLTLEEQSSLLSIYKPQNEYADLNIRDLKQRIVNKGLPVKYFKTKEELGQHVFEDWLEIINQLYPPLLQGPEFLGMLLEK